MHPILTYINPLTAYELLGSEEKCLLFLRDIDLIPRQENVPCKCGSTMLISKEKKRKLGWRWKCKGCRLTLGPLSNTFFEGSKLLISEILTIIFFFAWNVPITSAAKTLKEWRQGRGEKILEYKTVHDFYNFCRLVCEVSESHNSFENENNLPENSLTSPRNDKVIRKNTPEHYYRKRRLKESLSHGQQIANFLEDIKEVFPGPGKIGKELLERKPPTSESEGMEHPMPSSSSKRPRLELYEEEIGDQVPPVPYENILSG